jgi:hypothetical protein
MAGEIDSPQEESNYQDVPITWEGINTSDPEVGGPQREKFTQDNYDHEFPAYGIRTVYDHDTGFRVEPDANPDTSQTPNAVVVREHRGMMYKYVYWSGWRIGARMIIPSADTGSKNEVLLRRVIIADKPNQQPSSTNHRIHGYYVYALIRVLDETSTYPLGVSPAEDVLADDEDRNIQPKDFDDTILDASHADPLANDQAAPDYIDLSLRAIPAPPGAPAPPPIVP